jgi:hypothetical protein
VRQITAITNEPKQRMSFPIDCYDDAILTLEFKPNQYAWFFNLEWQSFAVFNQQLVFAPNVLRQYKNVLPFGFAVMSTNFQDPMTDDAFTPTHQIFILDADEVAELEGLFYGG